MGSEPGPSELLTELDYETALPRAPFSELHTRVIDRPIDEVWPACLSVTAKQVRTLGPLMMLRDVPKLFGAGRKVPVGVPKPLVDVFVENGFVLIRRDEVPTNGRATVLFGAIGKFWSPAHNAPIAMSPSELLAFDEPDFAKTIARLEAIDLGNGTTRIETETGIVGTDPASTRKFAPYWAIIRLPSGLIRRSWLAAIDRRVTAG